MPVSVVESKQELPNLPVARAMVSGADWSRWAALGGSHHPIVWWDGDKKVAEILAMCWGAEFVEV